MVMALYSGGPTMSFVPLEFVVVGASIAGLTAASILAKAGHDVTVVEKGGRLEEKHRARDGGLRVPPSMTRLLAHGYPELTKSLDEKWIKCTGMEFRSVKTSHLMGLMRFDPQVMSDLGSDYCLITYYDLCCLLREQCEKLKVRFRYNFQVERVEISDSRPSSVISPEGEIIEGDIIVGADGRNSIIRNVVACRAEESDVEDCVDLDEADPLPLHELLSTSIPIPISSLLQDEELSELATSSTQFTIWMGNSYIVSGSRHGDLYVLGHSKTTSRLDSDQDADYITDVPSSILQPSTIEYGPLLTKLFQLSSIVHPTIQVVHRLDSFVDTHGRAVVIGDAAHACVNTGSYNAALAMEDAYTLGELFSKITNRSQIASLFSAYDAIRLDRTRQTELHEMGGFLTAAMPAGPMRDLRDEGMKQTIHLQNAPDEHAEELAAQWSSWIRLFNYDAKDALDEWWLDWGRHYLPLQGAL
ncbi:FAD/NAD(P)-binding domain-containing protein [Hymenopellis radicata]|nr:FAD/NAD(P)-binding domain-containing protein [Hymenopellis radicata]